LKNTSGFTEERECRFVESGFVDSFRLFSDEAESIYLVGYEVVLELEIKGWRLDYHGDPTAGGQVKRILASAVHSDHCPVLIE
jgi:exodeoxyribonuclease-3